MNSILLKFAEVAATTAAAALTPLVIKTAKNHGPTVARAVGKTASGVARAVKQQFGK